MNFLILHFLMVFFSFLVFASDNNISNNLKYFHLSPHSELGKLVELSETGELEWQRIRTNIDFNEGFALCFCFSSNTEILKIIRNRISQFYSDRVKLQIYEPSNDPENLAENFIPKILHPDNSVFPGPVWIDLTKKTGKTWKQAKINLLAVLNSQREPLRNRRNEILFVALPFDEKKLTREIAPDLWAIRLFTFETNPLFLNQNALEQILNNVNKDNVKTSS